MCSCAPGADLEEDDKTRVNGMTMTNPISIVDLFSGPGGLGEGFSSVQGPSGPAYRIAVSIEKDEAALHGRDCGGIHPQSHVSETSAEVALTSEHAIGARARDTLLRIKSIYTP